MSEIPQGYEVVSISLRPTLDEMALEIYQLENEICRLKKEVKEAEDRGFKNGMLGLLRNKKCGRDKKLSFAGYVMVSYENNLKQNQRA